MIVAEILINVGSGYLAGSDCTDYSCRSGCTVASGENTRHILNSEVHPVAWMMPHFASDTLFYEVTAFDALTDRCDYDVTLQPEH